MTVFFRLHFGGVSGGRNAGFDRLMAIVLEIVNSPIFGKNPLKSEAKSFDGLWVRKRPSSGGNILLKSTCYDQKKQ
jgi:hypothetical protein